MSAQHVGTTTYTNGTAPGLLDADARSENFYVKFLQLHGDVAAGKHPRLTFSQAAANFISHDANSSVPPVAHSQAESPFQLPGLSSHSAQSIATPSAPFTAPKSTANTTAPRFNPVLLEKSSDLLDAEDRIRIRKARERLEKIIADQAKAEEAPRRGSVDVPLNLLALAHARVPPVSGLKRDSSEDTFDEDSYYSSKANSWSTEHTEPQIVHLDSTIVISDGEDDELYEPPTQMDVSMSRPGQSKLPGIHDPETPLSDGQWEPEWDEEDDYEPPAPSAFEDPNLSTAIPQAPNYKSGPQHAAHGQMHQYPSHLQGQHRGQREGPVPASPLNIAVNQIPTPAAPQPSRISPLTTGNITHTMQPQMSSLQQIPQQPKQNDYRRSSNQVQAVNAQQTAKELRKAKRLAKKAEREESKLKRKRGAVTPDKQNKKGKRRATTPQNASPEPYIKPEPTSPAPGLAAIPSRRPSVVHRHAEPPILSSPHNARPRSAYISDHEQSPRDYRYSGVEANRMAMLPPPVAHRPVHRDNHDLRRVASLQHARRPLSPTRDYMTYTDPRAPAPRYEQFERPISRGPSYREGSMRPPIARVVREPSPPRPVSSYGRSQPPPVGQIVEDAYGNRYVAELIPDEYPPPSRRPQEDYYGQQYAPSRRENPYENDPFRIPPPPNRSRAYSQVPEPAPVERRPRAYSRIPETAVAPPPRAYSVLPQNAPRASISHREYDEEPVYDRRPRYEEETSPNPAYTSEFPPRAYSVRPEAAVRLPEYSARAGSMAPGGGYVRREMAPPALPIVRSREHVPPGQEYRHPVYEAVPEGGRVQYDNRQAVNYRY